MSIAIDLYLFQINNWKILKLENTMKIKLLTCFAILALSAVSVADDHKQPNAESLLDDIRKDLTALNAQFVQYEVDANDNVSEKLKGFVWLKSPNKFKWEYSEPAPQLILANGELVWIYDEDLEQVTIKQQQNSQNPIYVLLNKQDTEDNFELKLLDKAEGYQEGENWIEMTPKKPGEDIKVVWLGIQNNDLRVIKLKNQMDNIVIFEFDKIIKNPDLAEDFFTFDIPEGIDVIRDSGFSSEF